MKNTHTHACRAPYALWSVLTPLGLVLWAAACPAHAAGAPAADPAQACASFQDQTIAPATIGLPTSGAHISSASLVGNAGGGDGQYCKLLGAILPVDSSAPPIQFEVNLPSAWNGKVLQLGGGGLDGSLVTGLRPPPGSEPTTASPLAQGYVTLGSDSGHTGQGFDARFALNAEAFHNFGGDQIKKTHDVALAIIRKRYGRAPTHSYFIGGSQGGHEGLIAVQRFPHDYDGVVSLYPVYNLTMVELASNGFAKALYADGGAGWLNPRKIALLQAAVYSACDALDGAQDGIISNLAGCERAFSIATVRATLRCPGGADTSDSCLSDAQIETVRKIASPYKLSFALPDGEQTFPGWSILEGAKFLTGLGQSKTPSHPPARTDAPKYNIEDASVRYMFTANPAIDSINDFNPADYQPQIKASAAVLNSTNSDIASYRDHGGKLILLHGTADELNPTYNSVNYYQRLVRRFGQQSLDRFVRFYLVPGFGHGVGIFDAQWDPLEALDAWVAGGKAPETLTAVDGNEGAERSRPLCRYPAWPKYQGSADVNAAASFSCVSGAGY